MTDYKRLAELKEKEWNETLFRRMDIDRDLVNLSKYTLTDSDNKVIPHAVSITLNDPANFAWNVESALNNATEQPVVTSDDKKLDTGYIEDALRALFKEADTRRTRRGKFPLSPVLDQLNCRRGRAAVRCVCQLDKDKKTLKVDLADWDTRYMVYGIGPQGLTWGSYKTQRTKDDILTEYGDIKGLEKKLTKDSGTYTVRDIWNPDGDELWIDDIKLYEQEHPFSEVPIIHQLVPMGTMLSDPNSLEREGESIFALIRDLVPELNRLVSVIQSLNLKALDAALQLKIPREDMDGSNPPDHDVVTAPGAVNKVPSEGGYFLMPLGELRQQAWLLHQMIETRIQRGSVNNFDMGTFTQPMSAVALVKVGEGKDQIFLPRLGTRGLLKQQLGEMIFRQIKLTEAKQVQIGKKTFDVAKLSGDFEIEYKYFIKSPEVDMARFTMAVSAGNLIPDRSKRRDILKRENPEEDERWLRWEEAERLFPTIKMHRTVEALYDLAKRGNPEAQDEAEMASAEMGLVLENVLSGNMQQPMASETTNKPQMPLLSLMGGGGKASAPTMPLPPIGGEENA